MRHLRFYEDMCVAGEVFLSYHYHSEKSDMLVYTVKTHRGYFLDRIRVFHYQDKNVVNVDYLYWDDNKKLYTREMTVPYENFVDEVLTAYDEIVNG